MPFTEEFPTRPAYSDTRDLIENALDELARRRAMWLGDDLAAIALLAGLTYDTEQALAQRVRDAAAKGRTWNDIARALDSNPTEARLRFGHR